MIEMCSYELLGAVVTGIMVSGVCFFYFRRRLLGSRTEDVEKIEVITSTFIDTQRESNEVLKKGLSDMVVSTAAMCAAMQEVTAGVNKITVKVDTLLDKLAIEGFENNYGKKR